MAVAKILVVEDETNFATFVCDVLKSSGYTVAAVVYSGGKAVEKTEALRPDLILMDVLLEGDLDGIAAAEEIHRRFETPVVYMTGYADVLTLQRAKLTNLFGYLVKPFDVKQLIATVEVALHQSALESKYRKSTRQHAAALRGIEDAVLVTDEKGLLAFMNPAAELLTGWKMEESSGKLWTEVFNIVSQSPAVLTDSSSITGLSDHAFMTTRNGARVAVDYSASLLRDETGATTGFAFIFRDVEHRRHIEQSLSDSRRKYKELVNSIEGIVWEADLRTHQFSFLSKQARRILGYPIEQWLSEPNFWLDHVHPDDRHRAEKFFSKATTSQKDYEIEYRMISLDGRSIWLRDLFNIVPLSGNQPLKLRGVMMDITERKRMEFALRQAHNELENRVEERTAELSQAVGSLKEQMAERKKAEEALAVSEQKYRNLIVSMSEGLLQVDNEDVILFVNPRFCEMLGYTEEELLGKNASALLLREADRPILQQKNLLRLKGISDQYEIQMKKKSGELIWLQISRAPVVESNNTIGSIGILTDVSTRKGAEEALRESEERYAMAALGANDGLWDWNLKANQIYYSPRWKTMLGFEDTEIGNSPDEWFKRVNPDDLEKVKAEITAHLGGSTPHFENEHRMLHKDGKYRWMLTRGIAVRDDWGAYRVAGSQTDITDRKVAVEQLVHDAFHDALTNLSNRALFLDRLKGAAARGASRAKRGGHYLFAVLFLDLDRFKVVNDSLGHLIGDQLLIDIARRLETCLRPGDTIARLGGDEFAILIEDINDVSDATHVAERVQLELTFPFNVHAHEVFTSASIGIALSSSGYNEGEDLLRDADIAMYRAKAFGKARHQIFDPSMHGTAVALLQLETDMRRAIERQEFLIHYQPIISLRTGVISGFEALVRWQHPDRGLLPPEELIPVAEDTGLIIPIGRWVLWEACRQMKAWKDQLKIDTDLTVSVNLSGKQFSQPDLTEQISRALRETGLPPESLKLEITESVIMENAAFATSTLLQLRALDVRLLIDDFGTGYSSLSYLHRFPINTLKIDRSFVGRIGVDSESWEIVRTIVTLANNLGMDIVAEGVETANQKEQLLALGCQHGQGYFFSRPVDSETAWKMIQDMQEFA